MPDTNAQAPNDDIQATLGLKGSAGSKTWRAVKWVLLLLVAAAVVAGGYFMLGGGGGSSKVQFTTDAAANGDVTVLVTATGTVEPTNQVDISSELSGIVREVNVDYNSKVKVGEPLAVLDTDKLKANVESAKAKLNAAIARVAEAEATVQEKDSEYQRKVSLAERNIASPQELHTALAAHDRAIAALDSAKADVTAAEAELRLQETNLDKACICSPIDGVVLSRDVDPGQVVAASLQAPVLFTIADDLSKMEVQVDVDEADINFASAEELPYPDKKFDAVIKSLRFGSEIVQSVVTYKAVLSTDNSNLLLRPGMTATAEIKVQEEKDVLTVSNEALRYAPPQSSTKKESRSILERIIPHPPRGTETATPRPTGKQRQIWVLKDGTPGKAMVTIGITDGKRTQIVEGDITAGDQIIVDATTSK